MKKSLFFVLLLANIYKVTDAQTDTVSSYTKKTYMVPTRDGVKLFTLVLSPTYQSSPLPFLIERTPYGSDFPLKEDSSLPVEEMGAYTAMAKEGYIFVFQDMRGKFNSEGHFEMNRPLYHVTDKTKQMKVQMPGML